MTPYKTNEANILYSVRQNNISNNNFQIADTCTHCVPIFINPRSHMTIQDAKTVRNEIEKGGKEKLINKINNYIN